MWWSSNPLSSIKINMEAFQVTFILMNGLPQRKKRNKESNTIFTLENLRNWSSVPTKSPMPRLSNKDKKFMSSSNVLWLLMNVILMTLKGESVMKDHLPMKLRWLILHKSRDLNWLSLQNIKFKSKSIIDQDFFNFNANEFYMLQTQTTILFIKFNTFHKSPLRLFETQIWTKALIKSIKISRLLMTNVHFLKHWVLKFTNEWSSTVFEKECRL